MMRWLNGLKERYMECIGLRRFEKNFWILVEMQQHCIQRYSIDIFNKKDQQAILPRDIGRKVRKNACHRALYMVKMIIEMHSDDKTLKGKFLTFVPATGSVC